MPLFRVQPCAPQDLLSLSQAGRQNPASPQPVLAACRATLTFRCDPPLDTAFFPGPALRGLLGSALASLPGPGAAAFLQTRFKTGGGDHPALWRIAFLTPPDPARAEFDAQFLTFGPDAPAGLATLTAAFRLPGLRLDLPRRSFRLSLAAAAEPEAALLSFDPLAENPPQPAGRLVHFLTPLVINSGGRPLQAAALASDIRPLLDSLRIRLLTLCGLRRDTPLPSPQPAPPPSSARLTDVTLPLPLQGRKETLCGIIGSLRLDGLTPLQASLLDLAPWLGAGRHTAFGAGTLLVEAASAQR